MNGLMTPLVRRVLAIAVLLALPLLAWTLIAAPVITMVRDREDEIITLSDRVVRLQAIIARIPALRANEQVLRKRLDAEGGIWTGGNEAVISARMEEVLRRTVQAGQGTVKRVAQLRGGTEKDLRTVRIRLSIEGTLGTVEKTLAAIDAAHPAMFVDSFTLAAPGAAPPPTQPPVLNLDLEVMGYLRRVEE